MASFDKKFSDLVDEVYNTPQGKAYLRMIKAAEGGEYNITFGNHTISDFSKHPNIRVKFDDRAGGGVSTAAGAYQITNPTWNSMAPRIAANDFGNRNQDRVALALALEKPGMRDAIMRGDIDAMVKGSNSIYTSLAGSKEGGRRHALRPMEFLTAAYNGTLGQYKGPAWTGQANANATRNATTGNTTVDFLSPAIQNLMGGSGNTFLESTLNDIQNKGYADPGRVPFNVYSGTHSVFNANPDLTDEANVQSLVNKLFNTDPNRQYGLSFVAGSLRPTVSVTNGDGNMVDMIELANGNYINAATGERMNADGTVYEGTPVEYLTPDYEAPQNSPEAMRALREGNIRQAAPIADMENEQAIVPVQSVAEPGNAITGEFNYQGPLPTAAETALPTSNTPLTTNVGSAASPTAYVDPNMQVVNALGGDAVTRTLNASRPVSENIKELLRLA